MAKKDGDKERPEHSGSVVAEDDEFSLWLNRLWARNEPPERLELWQMFGQNKAVRGEMIFHEDFKPGEKLNIEQVNKIANEIIAAAQNDCDSVRRNSSYQLAVIDRNRKVQPLTRRMGPFVPKRAYAIATYNMNAANTDDDEDGPQDAKSLELTYVKEGLEQARWDKQRYDKVMGEMLILQGSMIHELRQQNNLLFTQQMTFFEKLQEAEDRRLDRDIVREKEKWKLDLYKDGLRTARNLLPGIFAGANEAKTGNGTNGHTNGTNGHTNDTNGHTKTIKDYGPSNERTLVDNFLSDCESDERLMLALFGEYEEIDDKWTQTKTGIFTFKQFAILVGVRQGKLPVEKLDELMPKSGHENAITQDQVKKAGDAGVTEGIGTALLELVALRSRRKEEKEVTEQSAKDDQ